MLRPTFGAAPKGPPQAASALLRHLLPRRGWQRVEQGKDLGGGLGAGDRCERLPEALLPERGPVPGERSGVDEDLWDLQAQPDGKGLDVDGYRVPAPAELARQDPELAHRTGHARLLAEALVDLQGLAVAALCLFVVAAVLGEDAQVVNPGGPPGRGIR